MEIPQEMVSYHALRLVNVTIFQAYEIFHFIKCGFDPSKQNRDRKGNFSHVNNTQ